MHQKKTLNFSLIALKRTFPNIDRKHTFWSICLISLCYEPIKQKRWFSQTPWIHSEANSTSLLPRLPAYIFASFHLHPLLSAFRGQTLLATLTNFAVPPEPASCCLVTVDVNQHSLYSKAAVGKIPENKVWKFTHTLPPHLAAEFSASSVTVLQQKQPGNG